MHDKDTGRILNAEPVIHERAGYWKEIDEKRIYLFTSKGLDKASGSFGTRKAAEVLDSNGAIAGKETGRRSKKARTPDGHSVDFYWVDPDLPVSEQ